MGSAALVVITSLVHVHATAWLVKAQHDNVGMYSLAEITKSEKNNLGQ